MTTLRSSTIFVLGLFAALSAGSLARAQELPVGGSFQEELRFQPYVVGSVGGFPSGAGGPMTFGFGFGVDYLAYQGLGVGGSLALFGDGTFGFSVASFDVSYHFVQGSSRLVPFVKAGIGSGLNLWSLKGAAFRIELIDHFPVEGGDHHINVQLGVTF